MIEVKSKINGKELKSACEITVQSGVGTPNSSDRIEPLLFVPYEAGWAAEDQAGWACRRTRLDATTRCLPEVIGRLPDAERDRRYPAAGPV